MAPWPRTPAPVCLCTVRVPAGTGASACACYAATASGSQPPERHRTTLPAHPPSLCGAEFLGYLMNDSCEVAKHFVVFSSADPVISMNVLGDLVGVLPADLLTDLLGADEGMLAQLTKDAGQGGVMTECKKRCGIAA